MFVCVCVCCRVFMHRVKMPTLFVRFYVTDTSARNDTQRDQENIYSVVGSHTITYSIKFLSSACVCVCVCCLCIIPVHFFCSIHARLLVGVDWCPGRNDEYSRIASGVPSSPPPPWIPFTVSVSRFVLCRLCHSNHILGRRRQSLREQNGAQKQWMSVIKLALRVDG